MLVYNWCTVYERGFITSADKAELLWGQAGRMLHVENHHVLKWHFRSRYVSEQSPESLKSFKQTVYIVLIVLPV